MPTLYRRNLRRLQSIRLGDIAELIAIASAAMHTGWLLRRRPIAEVAARSHVALLQTPADEPPSDDVSALPAWAQRRCALTMFVMRHWPKGDVCLRRSLVLGHRLASLSPVLVIGVRPGTDQPIDAHAWLRINGVDLDPLSRAYLPFEFA